MKTLKERRIGGKG